MGREEKRRKGNKESGEDAWSKGNEMKEEKERR